MDILDQLNGYAGDSVWQDVIIWLDGYDEKATERLDRAYMSDRFIAGGTAYRWDNDRDRWDTWDCDPSERDAQ